jgi:flagellar protein FliS
VAGNLDRLYDYMGRRLLDANVNNDRAALEEVHRLLSGIKDAWDALPARLPAVEGPSAARAG